MLHKASNQLPASQAGRGLDKKVKFRAIKCNLSPKNAFSECGYVPTAFCAIPFIWGDFIKLASWRCIQSLSWMDEITHSIYKPPVEMGIG